MTKRPLREQLGNLLRRDRLKDDEFEALQASLNKTTPAKRPALQRRALAAMAASVLLAVGIWFGYNAQTPHDADSHSGLSMRIAEEVLTNHIHIRAMDMETSSMEQIRRGLDRLDFSPVSSEIITDGGLRLLGARYCTLQGRIATQLMFQNDNGDIVTFYQAAYDAERFGPLPDIDRQQRPLTLIKNGVSITIWVEQGVVVAQARTTGRNATG